MLSLSLLNSKSIQLFAVAAAGAPNTRGGDLFLFNQIFTIFAPCLSRKKKNEKKNEKLKIEKFRKSDLRQTKRKHQIESSIAQSVTRPNYKCELHCIPECTSYSIDEWIGQRHRHEHNCTLHNTVSASRRCCRSFPIQSFGHMKQMNEHILLSSAMSPIYISRHKNKRRNDTESYQVVPLARRKLTAN